MVFIINSPHGLAACPPTLNFRINKARIGPANAATPRNQKQSRKGLHCRLLMLHDRIHLPHRADSAVGSAVSVLNEAIRNSGKSCAERRIGVVMWLTKTDW